VVWSILVRETDENGSRVAKLDPWIFAGPSEESVLFGKSSF
jgi:hypothetical protein